MAECAIKLATKLFCFVSLSEKSCNICKELYPIFNSCLTCLLTFLDLEKAEFEFESGYRAPKTKIKYNSNFLFRG